MTLWNGLAADGRYDIMEWIDDLSLAVENPYVGRPDDPDDPDYADRVSGWFFENNLTDEEGTHNWTGVGSIAYESGSPIKGSYSADLENNDGDYGYVSAWTGLSGATGLTVTGWIKPESVGAVNKTILSAWDAVGNKRNFAILVETDQLALWLGYNGGASAVDAGIKHASNMSAATEYFFAVTYDQASDDAFLYLRNSTTCADIGTDFSNVAALSGGTWNDGEATDLMLGEYGTNASPANKEFDGLLDNISMYYKALTEQEIENICNGTPGNPGPTIDSLTITSETLNAVNSYFNATLGLSEDSVVDITGGRPSFELEAGANDITCEFSTGNSTSSHIYICGPILYGMSAEPLTLKSSDLALNSGTFEDTLENSGTVTLPALTGSKNIRGVVDTDITHGGTSF